MASNPDANQIRNKRLAKLTSDTATESRSPHDAASPTRSPRHGPISQDTSPKTSQLEQPFILADIEQPERPTPSLVTNLPANRGETLSIPQIPESDEDLEDRILRSVFQISVVDRGVFPQQQYLPGLRNELEADGRPLKITLLILDQALLEAASSRVDNKPLYYLLPCWKRLSALYRNPKKRSSSHDRKHEIIAEARRLCMSYCIFAVTMPEMFGQEFQDEPTGSPLKQHLLVDPEDDLGITPEFILESVKRSEDDEAIIPAYVRAVEGMSQDLRRYTMSADYKPYVTALRSLVRFPRLAAAITESPLFNAVVPAQMLETSTLLGPWFRLSPLQRAVTLSYFSSPKTRDPGYIINSQRSMRMMQQMHSSDLLDIINHMIRSTKSARDHVLDWFAMIVNLNHKRRAMHVEPNTVSSDGFLFNVTTCLDQLCEPFTDSSFSKVDRIDVDYPKRNPRVDIKDETKMNADQKESDEFYSNNIVHGTSNFISEIFFLTVAAHHYGSSSMMSKVEQLEKDLRHMETQIDKLEQERHKWIASHNELRLFDNALKKYRDSYEQGLALKYGLQGVLLDDLWQARSLQFMRYVIVWLLRVASGRNFPHESITLPLPDDQPKGFRCLPEYFLDGIISNFNFIMWHIPQIITSTQGDELTMICITFLQSSQYVKNPYLKAGLVTVLCRGTWRRISGARGVLVDILNSLPFANEYLLHALMKFYIEAEFTGTHTQFSDKFNIRFEIFQIIKCIWPNSVYQQKLFSESQGNVDFFVQFVNLLLNDVTFVLDESFSAFVTIHDTQVELARGVDMDPTTRQEKEQLLSTTRGRAKAYMQLTNETVAMLKLFTAVLAGAFTMPEIVQRLADMLDYNLDTMVGPRSSNLRVDNLSEYGFNPRTLLSEIVDVYLNLMSKDSFILAVSRDGRSYKPLNFEKTTGILKKWSLKSTEDLVKWNQFQDKIKAAKEATDQEEENLGEVPDDFLDPIIFTLMEDPVILPRSRISVDRATIRSHLLSDPKDPFNRQPLSIDDVIPDTALKERIEEFKRERKQRKLHSVTNENRHDEMDRTPG